jgi:hypothetical protein
MSGINLQDAVDRIEVLFVEARKFSWDPKIADMAISDVIDRIDSIEPAELATALRESATLSLDDDVPGWIAKKFLTVPHQGLELVPAKLTQFERLISKESLGIEEGLLTRYTIPDVTVFQSAEPETLPLIHFDMEVHGDRQRVKLTRLKHLVASSEAELLKKKYNLPFEYASIAGKLMKEIHKKQVEALNSLSSLEAPEDEKRTLRTELKAFKQSEEAKVNYVIAYTGLLVGHKQQLHRTILDILHLEANLKRKLLDPKYRGLADNVVLFVADLRDGRRDLIDPSNVSKLPMRDICDVTGAFTYPQAGLHVRQQMHLSLFDLFKDTYDALL